jgi:hypothetical protein
MQTLFDYMASHGHLTLPACRLFQHANLTQILLPASAYPDLSQQWLAVLTGREVGTLNSTLLELDLSHCLDVTDTIADCLSACNSLRRLVLRGCIRITDQAVERIVPRQQGLECLCLSECKQLTDASLVAIATVSTLRHLSLEACHKISDGGVALLVACPHLTLLNLGWCGRKITSSGVGWIRNLQELTELNLAYTRVEDGLELLSHLPLLKRLHLGGTPFGSPVKVHRPHIAYIILNKLFFFILHHVNYVASYTSSLFLHLPSLIDAHGIRPVSSLGSPAHAYHCVCRPLHQSPEHGAVVCSSRPAACGCVGA